MTHDSACERDWGRGRQDTQDDSNTHNDLTYKQQMRIYKMIWKDFSVKIVK